MVDAQHLERTAHLLAVISNPVRLAVLVALQDAGSLSAGELQRLLGTEATSLSHHLRQLKEAKLVVAQPRGRQRFYELSDQHVGHIVRDALAHVNCAAKPET